jgi:oxalate decarboxylase
MKEVHPMSGDGPVKIGRTDTITTPRPVNRALDEANPDSRVPPLSDVGSLPVFKYPFSLANKRVYAGGWSREVTVRELQIAKELAGVNMRLEAGGIRELHWHKAAEWSLMLYGSARLTAIDAEGRSFVRDVSEGDLWYFPTGIPHSIQGLGPDGAEFLLVFDDGHFSEHETVLLSDIAAHTPRDILARNFGVEPKALDGMFNEELFIFQAPVPGPLAPDQKIAAGMLGPSPCEFSFRPGERSVAKRTKGGEARIVDSSAFKVSTTVAVAIVTVHAGGMRELHWHPNADEWQYYLSGKARMTVVGTGARAHDGLRRWRCGLRSENLAALRCQRGRGGPAIPRSVQVKPFRRPLLLRMAGPHAARIGDGPLKHQRGHLQPDPTREAGDPAR